MEITPCKLCGTDSQWEAKAPDTNTFFTFHEYTCPNCGRYKIEVYTASFVEKKVKDKHLLSGLIRELHERGDSVDIINEENIGGFRAHPYIPKTTMEKLDKLLLYLFRKTDTLYEEIQYDKTPAIAYAKSSAELEQMVIALKEVGFLEFQPGGKVKLTLSGLQRAESLRKEVVNSKQCFVAMRFNDEMMEIYNRYITKAAQDAEYQSLITSQEDYNEKICDKIIWQIRQSKFLIADFTGHRGEVYFEAGFALGLGLPVIWTCNKGHLSKLHFDIRQYNFIDWTTGEELQERLTNRIRATVL